MRLVLAELNLKQIVDKLNTEFAGGYQKSLSFGMTKRESLQRILMV